MKPLHILRKIAKERVAEMILNLGDEELFGFSDCGNKEDMSRVHNELLARILQ